MKKLLVDYTAYLSELFKLPENIGKTEKDLIRENNLYVRAYYIQKCGAKICRKCSIPRNSYQIFSILKLNNTTLSEEENVAVSITEEELQTLNIAPSNVYELERTHLDGYYTRQFDNVYLMEELSFEEAMSLDSEEDCSYYNNFASKGVRYVKKQNADGTVSLVVLHDINSKQKTYFKCDEDYPENLKEIVSYLKINSKETYTEEELPTRSTKRKSIIGLNRKLKNKANNKK